MKFFCELSPGVSRKKLFFGATVIYSVIFACLLYMYGWNFLPVFRFQQVVSDKLTASQTQDFELDYDDSNSSKVLVHRPLDIHLEDPVLGHTGSVSQEFSGHTDDDTSGKTVVAIGGGITSVRLTDVKADNMKSKFQFFTVLLPSFCRTASKYGYHYNFYLAYDSNDQVFSQHDLLIAFQNAFDSVKNSKCSSISMALHFVECRHTGHPAWAQNDAMMEAYLDGSEYFYRVNDDSRMQSSGWTQVFVDRLAAYDPPNVGVVGPKHSGGNELILTYDFVHRTHVDVFGFYYPRVFTDWYADDWITKVYLPDHSTKIRTILLEHTMKLGQRYKNDYSVFPKLGERLKTDIQTLKRYITYRKKTDLPQPDGSKVISMSLYGKDPRYSWGVIRNAQLLPIVFPDWTIRIYVPKTDAQGSSSLAVPPRIISCLKRLGVQIVFVDPSKTGAIPPRWWRYLAADDLSVNFFIVRDADSRLSERDAIAVNDWIKTTSPVHCIRDQPSHATQAVVDGLWGGKPKEMHKILNCSVHSMLLKYFGHGTTSSPVESNGQANVSSVNNNANAENRLAFLADALWPRLVSASLCHDSVSCRNWTRTLSFPVEPPASSKEYLGQSFNEHQTVVTETDARAVDECSGRGKVSFAEENTGRQSNDVVSDQADSAGTSSAVKLFDDVSESTNVSAFARLESRWHEVPS